MRAELWFTIISSLPMPLWAVWIWAPRTRAAAYLRDATWPLAVLVILWLVSLGFFFTESALDAESFTTLPGVMRLFSTPWGATTGWAHLICFDVAVGRWIAQRGAPAGYRLSPVLLLTGLFGPAGLGVFLACRRWLEAPRPSGSPPARADHVHARPG